MIFKDLLVIFLLAAGTFFLVRRIIKLPSKYERQPKIVTSWRALDEGIDPTLESTFDSTMKNERNDKSQP